MYFRMRPPALTVAACVVLLYSPRISSSFMHPALPHHPSSVSVSTGMAVHVLLTHLIKLNKGCEGEKRVTKTESKRGDSTLST